MNGPLSEVADRGMFERYRKLEQENAKLKAELEKSQCILAGFMVAEDQEKAGLKERVAKLEKVREAAEIYASISVSAKAEFQRIDLRNALNVFYLEASDDKQD